MTESDDEPRPHIAQNPDARIEANGDSERHAISATEAVAATGAVESEMFPKPDEASESTDSSLGSARNGRKRKCRSGVKKPRIQWHDIQVFNRDAMKLA